MDNDDISKKSNHPNITRVDRQEISEIFADSVGTVYVHNNVLRMEYIVNRLDDPKPGSTPTGRAITVCRVVMPINSIIDIASKLQDIIAKLHASGVIRHVHNPDNPGPIRPN